MQTHPVDGWTFVTHVIPVLFVIASLPLLALAALANLLRADDAVAWAFAAGGAACWATGIAWGILVNRIGPSLRPA